MSEGIKETEGQDREFDSGIKETEGQDREFDSGAKRQNADGKGLPTLVSPLFEEHLWKHLEAGAKHYEPRNWEKGIPLSEILNSLLRHIKAERMRDGSENHLGAIACNAMFYVHTKEAIKRGILPEILDDLPEYRKDVK